MIDDYVGLVIETPAGSRDPGGSPVPVGVEATVVDTKGRWVIAERADGHGMVYVPASKVEGFKRTEAKDTRTPEQKRADRSAVNRGEKTSSRANSKAKTPPGPPKSRAGRSVAPSGSRKTLDVGPTPEID